MSNTFKYFAYGSNLLQERIRLKNPTATFISIAKLEDFKLGFDRVQCEADYAVWRGCSATILSCPGSTVWGCLWTLHIDNMQTLDDQEGVSQGYYRALEVEVETAAGEKHRCRTYQLLHEGAEDKRPSPQYLDVILRGARQNCLPQEYVDRLQAIEHNGNTERVKVYEDVMAMIQQQETS